MNQLILNTEWQHLLLFGLFHHICKLAVISFPNICNLCPKDQDKIMDMYIYILNTRNFRCKYIGQNILPVYIPYKYSKNSSLI